MNKLEYAQNFARNLEIQRTRLDLSQEQMARRLGLSLSAYKRIINGDTQKVDIFICYLGYKMTHKFLFEMVDYQDKYVNVFRKIHGLTDNQLHAIDNLIDTFLEEKNVN